MHINFKPRKSQLLLFLSLSSSTPSYTSLSFSFPLPTRDPIPPPSLSLARGRHFPAAAAPSKTQNKAIRAIGKLETIIFRSVDLARKNGAQLRINAPGSVEKKIETAGDHRANSGSRFSDWNLKTTLFFGISGGPWLGCCRQAPPRLCTDIGGG